MWFLLQMVLAQLSKLPRTQKKGQTLVEYSLILAIIGIVLIAAFGLLSKQIIIIFSAITTLLDSAQSSSF
jgi:Flp pilus assembly pilin Flp